VLTKKYGDLCIKAREKGRVKPGAATALGANVEDTDLEGTQAAGLVGSRLERIR